MRIFGLEVDGEWVQSAIVAGTLLLFIALAFLSRFILTGIVRLAGRGTGDKLGDLIIGALVRPIFAFLLVAGLWLTLGQIPELSPHLHVVQQIGTILVTGITVMAVVNGVHALLLWYSTEIASRTGAAADQTIIPLLQRVSDVLIYGLGLLIILNQFKIDINPILAGLGIGGLAVALALQPTLTNFLAGAYVVSDAVVHIGDYINLDSGQDGYVEDIGWRATKIRSWQGNLIILPNSKLADAIVVDYEKPERAMLFTVDCGVSYDSDLARVERVTMEVATEILRSLPEGAKDFEPLVRFKHFGDSNIDFAVVLKSADRVAHFVVKHEFIKALHERFGKEGIEIQYPARKLYFADGQDRSLPDAIQQLAEDIRKRESDSQS